MSAPKVYNIPAGVPFADALTAELLRRAGTPEELSHMRVLLPTRRACRTVRESFLRIGGGKPLLLPRLQPLGDIDEDELSFGADIDFALPPAIDPLKRQIILSKLVMARPDFEQGAGHAMALAGALGRLMDRIYTENLNMADLPALAGEFATHWEVTLEFLKIISENWPKILAERGVIDAADRRNRLINALSDHWTKNPPQAPVIAAGSTGSIPATARLLQVIANLPQGAVILPGLDVGMDEDSWQTLEDTHPQATLKHLLAQLEIERRDVKSWSVAEDHAGSRRWLVSEIMRPAASSGAWANLHTKSGAREQADRALQNLMRADADTPQEEARLIAVLMRGALEEPGRTAALVTPDRDLARRVAVACRRWGINVDDSAGQRLTDTVTGSFLRLCTRACISNLAPGALLALLRHRLCNQQHDLVSKLEIKGLRGAKPPPGIEGLRNRLAERRDGKELEKFLDKLQKALSPFLELAQQEQVEFHVLLDGHIKTAEALAGADRLWSGDDGEAAALFLSNLRAQAAELPAMNAEDYLAVLEQLMAGVTVRRAWGTHPRLFILGQLEARLLQADLVILGGLNEGTWPPDAGHDPWMSRPMMKRFGLPAPERGTGLSAHDFAQGFCARDVVLTRARRIDGTPAVPARWLQRLDTVLQALKIDPKEITREGERWLDLVRRMDRAPAQKSYPRPAPVPPVSLRPRELSATRIETWMSDPYSIYARYVLRLKKLDALEKAPDAADRGNFLHHVMDRFVKDHPATLPADAAKKIIAYGSDHLARRADDPGFWDFWWPRFERLANWTAAHERDWRRTSTPVKTEVPGEMTLGNFTLTAKADRIDRLSNGSYAIIDYKSGGAFSKSKIASGESPQLPLEGLIAQAGGFEDVASGNVGWLGYWVMTGGEPPGEVECLDDNVADTLAETRAGLEALIKLYDDPKTAYHAIPDPDRAPRYNDYEQLARVQEWTALGDAGGEEAA